MTLDINICGGRAERKRGRPMNARRQLKTGPGGANVEIDAGLLVLTLMNRSGEALSQRDIAFVCGCTSSFIQQVEAKALKKIRRHLQREKNAEVCDALRALLSQAGRRAA